MSFNQFVDRNYLITNPFNPNFNGHNANRTDWYHFKDYSKPQTTYTVDIDYQPDHNTMKELAPRVEVKEEKKDEEYELVRTFLKE